MTYSESVLISLIHCRGVIHSIYWSTVGDFLSYCRGVKHPFSACLPYSLESWNINNLPRPGLFPIIDIMGNFLSYKDMLTRLESLLYKALRGIGLVELPIIVAVIAWLLACRCNYGRVTRWRWRIVQVKLQKDSGLLRGIGLLLYWTVYLVLTGRGISKRWDNRSTLST